MRSKAILGDIQNLPEEEQKKLIELAKLEALLNISHELGRIYQTLKNILACLENGISVYPEKVE